MVAREENSTRNSLRTVGPKHIFTLEAWQDTEPRRNVISCRVIVIVREGKRIERSIKIGLIQYEFGLEKQPSILNIVGGD